MQFKKNFQTREKKMLNVTYLQETKKKEFQKTNKKKKEKNNLRYYLEDLTRE